mmetsp:Transcript_9224/g.25821  ORF Transcript_9224/g.25821 Transcript_9224/m.25821 type:complete len:226 (+) Transcript_9224:315-992(+)
MRRWTSHEALLHRTTALWMKTARPLLRPWPHGRRGANSHGRQKTRAQGSLLTVRRHPTGHGASHRRASIWWCQHARGHGHKILLWHNGLDKSLNGHWSGWRLHKRRCPSRHGPHPNLVTHAECLRHGNLEWDGRWHPGIGPDDAADWRTLVLGRCCGNGNGVWNLRHGSERRRLHWWKRSHRWHVRGRPHCSHLGGRGRSLRIDHGRYVGHCSHRGSDYGGCNGW